MSKTWFGHYIENIKGDDYVLFTDYVELEKKIDRLNNELDHYKNNWGELKKELMKKSESVNTIKSILGDNAKVVNPHIEVLEQEYNYFLNKMKELEEGK